MCQAYASVLLQVDALERDALEMLGLVRSMKNHFAPISKIPLDVFSLIPKYLGDDGDDKNLIAMTHVCHGWRELLTTCPSLWGRLWCESIDRTRVYIERSKSAPLDISLYDWVDTDNLEEAFLLVVPHISRIKSLYIDVAGDLLQNLTPHLSCPAPLLSKLTIVNNDVPTDAFDTIFLNGDLKSLCSLSLSGATTHLPWRNLSKLTTFSLECAQVGETSITQLLDFFEDAHHLRDITLSHSIPPSSDASPGRVLSLPHLEKLTVELDLVNSILLNHLSIPAGASLTLTSGFTGDKSPVPDFLPKTLENLGNIFPISSINLFLANPWKSLRLSGPNGGLYMYGCWKVRDDRAAFTLDRRILRSLSRFDLSGTQRLAVARYKPPATGTVDKSTPYHILSRMKDLRTLTLTQCNNKSFILALNPGRNASKRVLCPKLEELVLYIEVLDLSNIKELMGMAKERASAGMKLSSITVVGLGELILGKEVFGLREHVTHADYRVREQSPGWDHVPGDRDN